MPIAPALDVTRWRDLFDSLAEAIVVVEQSGQVRFANTAALRLLPFEPGATLRAPSAGGADTLELPDGRRASVRWHRLDALHSAATLQPHGGQPRGGAAASAAPSAPPALRHADLGVVWESPFPATLQDSDFRLADVNAAYVAYTGLPRSALIGRDPLELQPEEDRAQMLALRQRLRESYARLDVPALIEQRLIDAGGRERWYRWSRRAVLGEAGQLFYLSQLQDSTAEHVARERADRSVRELDDWFDLSPVGMVLYDGGGLMVRSNLAFEALAGSVPVLLPQASPALQQLLAWDGDAPAAGLAPGSWPLETQAWIAQAGGEPRRLRSIVRCYRTQGGQARYMAVVDDRSAEEERDLAQMQIGALMDTAGVGLATFQESSGWVRQRLAGAGGGRTAAGPSAALQSISRELVAPGSMPEYERLQAALRGAQRAEVRYAIRHPELGLRWLLTRVEPATLASGKRTTSVVTLDITEQQQTQLRSQQLLHELGTILESSSAGIAYLRGNLLVRCNRRFEAMLGLTPGAGAGSTLSELFAAQPAAVRETVQTLQSLGAGAVHEAEFEAPAGRDEASGAAGWYSLSVRRTSPEVDTPEAIAVLTDITRLKSQQQQLEVLARDRELMFSLSGVGIAFVRDGVIQRANEAMAQLSGYAVEQLQSLPLAALSVSADEFAQRWPLAETALRRAGRWSGERPLRRADGQQLWVQISKRMVTPGDPAGGIIASYVDVDARHRAEESVALQAERTRAILDSVLVGIVTVGSRGIEWMNRSARRMFGGDLADFIGHPMSTVATPEADHPFSRTQYLHELIEGQAETFECRVKARDGREFWVVGNAVVTGGQLTYALLDIERRRQAEARVIEAQVSLQHVIEAAPLAITLYDAHNLKVRQINQVALSMIDQPVGAAIDCTPQQLYRPQFAAAMQRDMTDALASSSVTQREYRLDNGTEPRIWDARYMPLARPGQPPDQLLLVATDVTEQRAAQEARLEAAIAQREMLVKEVHHRIKNNLQGVAGLLQQIAQRKPEMAEAIAEVVGQVQAIAQVYGLQVGTGGPLQLHCVVEAITGSVQRTFGRSIRFETVGASCRDWLLPEAESIPIALSLNELLTNAVKHSVDGRGDVQCTLTCQGQGIGLSISNRATLAAEFSLARIPSGVSGLGLVRALLPRRSAQLTIEQQGERVVAFLGLQPPGITRPAKL